MSSVTARNFVISTPNVEETVRLTLNTPLTSYTINLPSSPPPPKSALFYDGTNYVWQEVVQSIPSSSIPTQYQGYQVFDTNLLLQSSDVEFTSGDVPVRMKIADGGVVVFQKYENGEWVGATVSLDGE